MSCSTDTATSKKGDGLDIQGILAATEAAKLRSALSEILTRYNQPAFGTLPKKETDILVFEVMRLLGIIDEKASVYDLMTQMRISRAKANQLLFDVAVRRIERSPDWLDNALIDTLCRAKFHQDADKYFVFEIEDPMLNAHLKERVRKTNFISDSSFNSALVRLPLAAVATLVDGLLDNRQKASVESALVSAGAPPAPTFVALLKSALKALGRKIVGDVSDEIVDQAGTYLAPILSESAAIFVKWSPIFIDWQDSENNEGA